MLVADSSIQKPSFAYHPQIIDFNDEDSISMKNEFTLFSNIKEIPTDDDRSGVSRMFVVSRDMDTEEMLAVLKDAQNLEYYDYTLFNDLKSKYMMDDIKTLIAQIEKWLHSMVSNFYVPKGHVLVQKVVTPISFYDFHAGDLAIHDMLYTKRYLGTLEVE